jgi:NTE family protein
VPEPAFAVPDVLVLAGGGVLGEAWMSGVLAGIEDASGLDLRRTESFVGTSAGALVAVALAAGQRPRRPGDEGRQRVGGGGSEPAEDLAGAAAGAQVTAAGWRRPLRPLEAVAREAARWAAVASTPLAPVALAAGVPGGAALRAALLAAAPGSDASLSVVRDRVRESGARFDGRLRVVAVDRASGRRVVFGAPGAPRAGVGEAVQASCAVPWIFSPVRIGGREYVDGGMWSATNLDVAPAGEGTEVLCLNPIASLDVALASPFGVLRAIAGGAAALETLALRGRGARVRTIGPEGETARLMGPNLMDARHRGEVLRGGHAQGLRLGA